MDRLSAARSLAELESTSDKGGTAASSSGGTAASSSEMPEEGEALASSLCRDRQILEQLVWGAALRVRSERFHPDPESPRTEHAKMTQAWDIAKADLAALLEVVTFEDCQWEWAKANLGSLARPLPSVVAKAKAAGTAYGKRLRQA